MPVKQLSNTCNANKRDASFAMPLQDIFSVSVQKYRKIPKISPSMYKPLQI